MKIILKLLLAIILTLNVNIILVRAYSNELEIIEEKLNNIEMDETYINETINHLYNLEITDETVEMIKNNINYLLENTKGKTNVSDFELSTLYNFYSKGKAIAKGFQLKLSMNFFTEELTIKNLEDTVLFKGNFDEIRSLYRKYLKLGYKKEEDIQYIVDNFKNEEMSEMVEDVIDEYKEYKENIEDDNLNDAESKLDNNSNEIESKSDNNEGIEVKQEENINEKDTVKEDSQIVNDYNVSEGQNLSKDKTLNKTNKNNDKLIIVRNIALIILMFVILRLRFKKGTKK